MTSANDPAHSLTGICARIGEDFGFNADWLRVPLAASLLWRPEVTLAVYAAMGVLVLASRLAVPARRRPARRLRLAASNPAPAAPPVPTAELAEAA